MRLLIVCCLVWLIPQPCFAWWEGGHHLIAVMAYELLSEAEQNKIQQLLQAHPRFVQDFATPPNVNGQEEINRWVIGRAGYWPDVARSQEEFNRPNWHFQLAATLTLGQVDVPKTPGPVPSDATLKTQKLYIAQAIELCRGVLRDKSRSDSDRAIAICWLAHLTGDSHQPCHAGSLYVESVFPEGDRGANLITVKQAKALHLLWDSLLGPGFDAGDIRRRARQITSDKELWDKAAEAAKAQDGLDPIKWLAESSEYGRSHVYAPEILSAIEAARRGSRVVEMIDLSEEYLKAAGELSRVRAAFAARRLAGILHSDLK